MENTNRIREEFEKLYVQVEKENLYPADIALKFFHAGLLIGYDSNFDRRVFADMQHYILNLMSKYTLKEKL